MALAVGTQLGSYQVLAALGSGGMGEVYRARDLRLGRDVALKVLPANVAASPDRLARIEREARTVAGLNHPNIVTLYSIEDQDGVRFLTMELVEGESLATLVTPGGLQVARVLELAIPLADSLAAAHERGVVHRDLKPANVMVTRQGRVKVLDFGLAKLAGPDSDAEPALAKTLTTPISAAGQVLGTVPYMAPEQLRGEAVDARGDLFAFGIMVYELAAGRRPFAGETAADVTSAILRDTPEPLTRLRTDLPGDLERVVSRCLEKRARDRFQAAAEVAHELRQLRRALEHGPARIPERPTSEKVASIAVLPFANRSADADDEYFSDGLADELINLLAKIKGLHVSARASSFQFKGRSEDLATIGARLRVATVLDGSVRKAGNRVRISVQLVRVSDGDHLWSEAYDRTLEDIFAVQDDIARSVVKELRTTLLGEAGGSDASGQARAEVARAGKGRCADPEAHRLFLLARHLTDRWTREDTARGIEYLSQALQRDARFAQACAALAIAHANSGDRGWTPVTEAYALAREAAERSLALEPDLAEGHAALGRIRMSHDWDWRGAEVSIGRALELAPGKADVLRMAGSLAWTLGRIEDAIALHRRALEQDPLSATSYSTLGWALQAAARFEEAESIGRKALELAPNREAGHTILALALLAQGRYDEALAEAGRETDDALRLWAPALIHHRMGHEAESRSALLELMEQHHEVSAYQIAEAHAVRGDLDSAFDWLELAWKQRDAGLTDTLASSRLRSLHEDPRWDAFLGRMGFTERAGAT